MRRRISAGIALCIVALACLVWAVAFAGSGVCFAAATGSDSARPHSGLTDRAYDAMSGSTFQSTIEHKKGMLVLGQQFSIRSALDWRLFLDGNLSTDKEPRDSQGVKESADGQIDIGNLTDTAPFSLVIPRQAWPDCGPVWQACSQTDTGWMCLGLCSSRLTLREAVLADRRG